MNAVSERKQLAERIAKEIFALGDEPNSPCLRLQFMGDTWPNNERDQGGVSLESLTKHIYGLLSPTPSEPPATEVGPDLDAEKLLADLRLVRTTKDEEFARAAIAEGKLDRIRDMLRDNMQILIPDWDFNNPDVVSGVEAELAHMQSAMMQAEITAAARRKELASMRERLSGLVKQWNEPGESHVATTARLCCSAELTAAIKGA